MRPDEPMNPKVSQRRMYVRKNCGQRRKRAGVKVMEGVVPRADEKGRAVEERVERGGGALGKVNLHLFTDEPQLEQMKHLLQETASRG